jgi:competence protein ComEC
VVAVSDGKEVSFTWENQKGDPSNAAQADITYVGNKNSKKFHAPGCASLPSEKNKVEFDTYEEAVEAGFTPCGSCLG